MSTNSQGAATMTPLNVLIVDDSATMRALLYRVIGLADLPIGAIYQAPNGAAQIDVAGQRVHFLAVNQDLHSADRRQIIGQRVDNGIHGEDLVDRPSGMIARDLGRQIDVGLAALADEQLLQRRPGGNRVGGGAVLGRPFSNSRVNQTETPSQGLPLVHMGH